jgi:hypothetical protein
MWFFAWYDEDLVRFSVPDNFLVKSCRRRRPA